jgi:1,4-dihydroxy-2-naphthoyl-CoA synthase
MTAPTPGRAPLQTPLLASPDRGLPSCVAATPAAAEGVNAFVEGRTPDFSGT